jgi:hypothetical protein
MISRNNMGIDPANISVLESNNGGYSLAFISLLSSKSYPYP